MAKKEKKSKGVKKLQSLLPKRKALIMLMPEEKDEAIHWLFWVLIILVVTFLISIVFLSWQSSSVLLSYFG